MKKWFILGILVLCPLFCIVGYLTETVFLFVYLGSMPIVILLLYFIHTCKQPKKRNAFRQTLKNPPPKDDRYETPKSQDQSRVIHTFGRHGPGIPYEEVSLERKNGTYYYVVLSVSDRFHAGGDSDKVPQECLTDTGVDTVALLRYIAQKHRYMYSLCTYDPDYDPKKQNP